VEFHLSDANFTFDDTNLDVLLVLGAKAYVFGTGTINGVGQYNFMMIAVDGAADGSDPYDEDLFRIKIWEEVGGVSNVVYDSGLGLPDFDDLALLESFGGNISVH
jgi:hypothetical protein